MGSKKNLDRHGRRIPKRRRKNPACGLDLSKLDLIRIGRGMQVAGKVIEIAGEIQAMRAEDNAKKKAKTESA